MSNKDLPGNNVNSDSAADSTKLSDEELDFNGGRARIRGVSGVSSAGSTKSSNEEDESILSSAIFLPRR